jgi:uncharacterized protein YchJ
MKRKKKNNYDYVGNCHENLTFVKLNGKYGFIDNTGKEIIPLKYDKVLRFPEELIYVRLNGKNLYVDKQSNEYEEAAMKHRQFNSTRLFHEK